METLSDKIKDYKLSIIQGGYSLMPNITKELITTYAVEEKTLVTAVFLHNDPDFYDLYPCSVEQLLSALPDKGKNASYMVGRATGTLANFGSVIKEALDIDTGVRRLFIVSLPEDLTDIECKGFTKILDSLLLQSNVKLVINKSRVVSKTKIEKRLILIRKEEKCEG